MGSVTGADTLAMAVSRPLLIALVGAVLVAGAFMATRGLGGGNASGAPSATPGAVDAPTAPDATEPEEVASGESENGRAPGADQARGGGQPHGARQGRGQSPTGQRRSGRSYPAPVERALDRGKVVVVTLLDRGGGDDRRTFDRLLAMAARPGAEIRRGRNVAIFPDVLTNVARYVGLTQALQVTRAPAAIIIDERRRARVVQGFTDASSLRQHVADALDRGSGPGSG